MLKCSLWFCGSGLVARSAEDQPGHSAGCSTPFLPQDPSFPQDSLVFMVSPTGFTGFLPQDSLVFMVSPQDSLVFMVSPTGFTGLHSFSHRIHWSSLVFMVSPTGFTGLHGFSHRIHWSSRFLPQDSLVFTVSLSWFSDHYITRHLADAFIQSDLQLIRLSRRHTQCGAKGLVQAANGCADLIVATPGIQPPTLRVQVK